MIWEKLGFLISFGIILIVVGLAQKTQAEEIDLSVGLYHVAQHNWMGTTGAEYGSGPMVILEASKPVSQSFDVSLVHKSYLLTGAPFNNNYESSFTAIGFKWRVSL
jgi:hypothetical protein